MDLQKTRKLITKNLHKLIKPQWSPDGNWIALLLDKTPLNTSKSHFYRQSVENYPQKEQHIYLYSLLSNDLLPIQIGKDIPLTFTWSDNDYSLYLATINSESIKQDDDLNEEWYDVIQYRQDKKSQQTTIYRVDINKENQLLSVKRHLIVTNTPFFIAELLFASFEEKLFFTSVSPLMEDLQDFELYSLDLRNTSSLVRLTYNGTIEENLRLSNDGVHVLFQSRSFRFK